MCEIGARQRVRKQEEGTMRRWIWRALLLVAVMAALTVGAAAATEEKSGNFGLTLNTAGTAYTVTSYTANADTVTIPSTFKGLPVTAIGKEVFQGKSLTVVRGLETIEEIGENAFASSSLKSVDIPGTMKSIEASAFANCGSLTSVKFKDGAKSGAGSSITEIKKDAFNGCTSLTTLDLSSSVRSIGENAFFNTAVTQVIVWEGTNSIGPRAFAGCKNLSSVAISGDVKTIDQGAFLPTDKLKVIHYGGADNSYPASAGWTGDVHYNTIVSNKITAPKCDARGSSSRTVQCPTPASGCPSVSTREEIAELGHDIIHTLDSTDPDPFKSCQDHTDTYTDTCSRCDYTRTYTVEVSATDPHQWGDEKEDTANTVQPKDCKTPGVKRFCHECTVCGTSEPLAKTELIPALPHKYDGKKPASEARVIREATCAEEGYKVLDYVCDVCGEVRECKTCKDNEGKEITEAYLQHLANKDEHASLETLDKTPHTWGEKTYDYKEEADKPTCAKKGTLTAVKVCAACGEKEWDTTDTKQEDMTDHTPPDGYKEEIIEAGDCETPKKIKYPAYECQVCHETVPERTEEGTAPGEHTWTEDPDHPAPKNPVKAPTCQEEGETLTAGQICSVCGKTIAPVKVILPKTAHNWGAPVKDENPGEGKADKAPTCGEEGVEYVIVVCQNKLSDGTVCGETEHQEIKLPATGKHDWGEWTIKEPTLTQPGEKKRVCKICEKEDIIVLPATGEPSDPDDPNKPTDPEKPKTYSITVVQGAGGTASVNRTTAEEGDQITVTLSPNSGYELDMIRAIGGGTSVLSLTDLGGGRHRFTMPASNVEIRVTFERRNSGSSWAAAPGDGSANGNARRTTDVMPTQNATLGVPQAGASEQRFRDVPMGHWAAGEIEWANQMGYMNGTGGRFNPDGNISNQQMWMVLARLTGSNPANMAEARHWAVQGGYADGSAPAGPVKRHQLVTALYRCARLSGSVNRNTTSLAGYNDSRNVPAVARDAFSWALANGIISGSADKNLMPNGYITRAQFAVILYRYSQRI